MEKSFDVIGIGWPCVDYAMHVQSMPKADSGSSVLGASWQGGGVVPTGLAAASRLGLRCALIGCVGDDLMGQFCRQDLIDHGIDVSHLQVMQDSTTDMAVVLSDDETQGRSILYRSGTLDWRKAGKIDLDFVRQAKYLFISGFNDGIIEAAKAVREAGGKVLIDASGGNLNRWAGIVPYVDYLVGSSYLYRDSFSDDHYEENIRKVQAMGPEVAAFTFGSFGVRAADAREYVEVPAFKVDVVDTLGAGDVFHGAFFYGLVHGLPLRDTIRFASAVSAIKCTAPGGRAGIPREDTVKRFLETGEIDREEIDQRAEKYAWGLDRFLREHGTDPV